MFMIVLVVAILVFLYIWYGKIITRKNKVLEALSDIDVQLKKRCDLIPNILRLTDKFKNHETTLFQRVTALRTQAMTATPQKIGDQRIATENKLGDAMKQYFAVMENYPELKSNQNFLQAQATYDEVETHIAAARRFYNSALATFKNSIQIFPGNILIKLISMPTFPDFYVADPIDKETINVDEFIKEDK